MQSDLLMAIASSWWWHEKPILFMRDQVFVSWFHWSINQDRDQDQEEVAIVTVNEDGKKYPYHEFQIWE